TDTGAPCALLLPKFLACARNLLAVLGGRRTLAQRRPVVLDRFPKKRFVYFPREKIVEFELANLGSREIDYIDVCHLYFFLCMPTMRHTLILLGCVTRFVPRAASY